MSLHGSSAQNNLPRLPIPDLHTTCQKYLLALRPLQSPLEHRDTQIAVDTFLNDQGSQLQEQLKQYAKGKTSYIEEFWYDSYLKYENPVVLNLNPFFLLEDDPTPARNNQVTRAASLVVSALSFIRALRRDELPPDTVRGQSLDMYQYSRMFGTARIASEEGCHIEQDLESRHIVVLAHGQFYWFDVMNDDYDLVMTEKDIAVNLQTIINDASRTPVQEAAKGALGVLSTGNRKDWSMLRASLSSENESNNADCLDIVDTALFVLCLDYTEPQTTSDLCMNMLCGTSEIEKGIQVGTCTNRWYDKLQIIVCRNGSAGINFEHTSVDGHTVLRFASDVFTDTILRYARTINGFAPSLWKSSSPDPSKLSPASLSTLSTIPHKLEWTLNPTLSLSLRFAETRLADLINQNEFCTLEYSQYGKSFITSHGCSPDAYLQIAFQTAYYGLYGRTECVYEPAMTKRFFHGRTEAIRPVTDESVSFVKTYWSDQHAPDKKVDLLRQACLRHVQISKECGMGLGQDRHLYALLCLWQRNQLNDNNENVGVEKGQLPPIFADQGWDKLSNSVLSTSNCGNPSLRHFGFGPTSAEGFGIGYIIKEDAISVCASSKHRQTKRFVDAIESCLGQFRKLLVLVKKEGLEKEIGMEGEVELSRRSSRFNMDSSVSSGKMRMVRNKGRMIGNDDMKDDTGNDKMDDENNDNDDGLGGCK